MFSFKIFIILATCLSWSLGKLDRYCSICENHTMCKFQGLGKDCEKPGGSGVTDAEKAEIVDVHNWVRRVIAGGHETRGVGGPQPKAANLRKMYWDDELATVAQRWADQCKFQHDTCRNDERWQVGQNLYWSWKYPKHPVNWTQAILSWYDEVALHNSNEVEVYRFVETTGHYTQMLWHDTYVVGCGRRDYGYNKIYVCNYGPAGNWIGEPLYTVGEPCSQCPEGTYCSDYLCDVKVNKPSKGADNVTDTAPTKVETSTPKNVEDKNLEAIIPLTTNTEVPEIKNTSCKTQVKPEHEDNTLNDVDTDEHKTTAHSIENNNIELDEETRKGIQEIVHSIEKLFIHFLRRLKVTKA